MSNAFCFKCFFIRVEYSFFISFYLLITSCTSNVNHFKNAQKEFLEDDYIGAIIELNTLFELNGKTDSALVLRAKCYLKIQKSNKAFQDLKDAIHLNNSNSEAKLELGRYYVSIEDTVSALNVLTQVSQGLGNNASEAFIELGKINYFNDKYEVSILNFSNAIVKDSNNYLAWYYRAIMRSTFYDKDETSKVSLFKYLDFNQAIKDFATSISIKKDFADAWYRMGLVYLNKFDTSNGIRAIDYAIQLEPENSYYYLGRADHYFRQKNYEKAIEQYSKAIKITQNDPNSFEGRAFAYKALGQLELFKKDFTEAYLLRKKMKYYKSM